MSVSPHRRLRATLRRAGAAAAVLPVAASLMAPPAMAQETSSSMWTPAPSKTERAPIRETGQDIKGLPEGVSVKSVQWLSERHVKILVNSAAMPDRSIGVELLLPRDWSRDEGRTFPAVWHLDGMRAAKDASGWTTQTTIEDFYADKNVLVVLPIGGESSFYSDWDKEDQGVHYMWETFLIDELIPVLEKGWRANGDRAIIGLSMGGTGAMNLAHHHPDLFKFAGSFSGFLDTTSSGMPGAIADAMKEAGGYDATKMWGDFNSARWRDNDPKLHVGDLKNMSLYVSAGTGNTGQWDIPSADDPTMPADTVGWGLELISRMTTETFTQLARREGVKVTAKFRDSGTHSWPYWQYETTQAWPYVADALGLSQQDRGLSCTVGGDIAKAVDGLEGVGHCLTGEYDTTGGGRAQDFEGGRAYWHPDHGAHVLWGRIGARYAELGGPQSALGYPLTNERATPDGKGRFAHFEHGSIYWTPDTNAWAVLGDFVNAWGGAGWEQGPMGYPSGARRDVAGGSAQDFTGGLIARGKDLDAQAVYGDIAKAYRAAGGPEGSLGFPLTGELPLRDGGRFQRFEHGAIYWTPELGAHIVPGGAILDHWAASGWENGPFGYPVGDRKEIPSGGLEQEFQGGWIREINGQIQEERK